MPVMWLFLPNDAAENNPHATLSTLVANARVDGSPARSSAGSILDFGESEFEWLTEIVRSHREAIDQLHSLPADVRTSLAVELARRQLVLGSDGFVRLVKMMSTYADDVAQHRASAKGLSRDDLIALEEDMSRKLATIREKIASIKYLLESI